MLTVRVYNVQMPHVYRTEAERKRNGNGKNRGTAVQRKRNRNFFLSPTVVARTGPVHAVTRPRDISVSIWIPRNVSFV